MIVSNHQGMVKYHRTIVTASTLEGKDRKPHDILSSDQNRSIKLILIPVVEILQRTENDVMFELKKKNKQKTASIFGFNKEECMKRMISYCEEKTREKKIVIDRNTRISRLGIRKIRRSRSINEKKRYILNIRIR